MSEIRNPHDRFFRETFSRLEVARDFIAEYLPQEVVAALNLNTLELDKDSFVDEELREHFSDLLYNVQQANGEQANIYLLLEHKSSPEVWVSLQLLRYMVRIWERARQEKAKQLPPIIPIVVYHGREKWEISENFSGLFGGEEVLRPYWPHFQYELQDLSQIDQNNLQGNLLLRTTLLALMKSFDPALPEYLEEIFSHLARLSDRNMAVEFLQVVVIYISVAANDVTYDQVSNAINAAFKKDGDTIMGGFVKEFIEQGLEQGLEQSILRVLARRFNQVPAGIEARLQRMPVARLELVLDEAVMASSLSDFDTRLGKLEEASNP